MSEGEAFRRITAARLVQRFPSLLSRLERNEIHLSNLVLIRKHLTSENYEELASAVSRRTKREVEQLIATRFPKPDVPSTIRQLPTRAPTPALATPSPAPSSAEPLLLHAAQGAETTPAVPPKPAVAAARIHRPEQRASRIEPLSAERHVMNLSMSTGLRKKIEYATAMMRHRNPSGALEVVMERAIDELIATLEKGERCTYVEEASGKRCPATLVFVFGGRFLELDHIHPRALGGSGEAMNVRVRCKAHNLHSAEEIFGREHVARQAHLRQSKFTATAANSATPGAQAPTISESHSEASRIAETESLERYRVITSALCELGFRESEARHALGVVASKLEPSTTLSALPIGSVLRDALVVLGEALAPAQVVRWSPTRAAT